VIQAVKKNGVHIYYADRRIAKLWNRDKEDLLRYCGWYWYRTYKGRVIDHDESGPFRTRMAATRDAFIKLQLR
jgi:hypothetical protein